MRVLHVISNLDPRGGGPPTALHGLASAQAAIGLDVRVVVTCRADDDPSLIEALTDAKVQVHVLRPCIGPLCRHPNLVRVLDQAISDADVVHIHALWEEVQYQAARLARRHGVPYLIRPCGMLAPWSLAQSKWKKKLYLAWRLRSMLNHAAAIHFTSNEEQEQTRSLNLAAPTIVQSNGVTLAEFEQLPSPGRFREAHPTVGRRRLILFMSRLHRKKGLELLIPAFAQADLDDTCLVLAGPDDGGYRQTVEALVREHSLQDRVLLPGMLQGEEKLAALVDADLFVLPSYQENFGIAVVEALAAGTAVLISDQVNIHGQISEAGVGGVVPLDQAAIALALHDWMVDEPRRADAGRRARSFVWQTYDWQRIAEQWARRYCRLAPTPASDDEQS